MAQPSSLTPTRRQFLKAAAASMTALALSPTHARADRKPNVIIIYTDDQGSLDLNCYGSSDLVTPNMDRIVQGGVRFTQFYAPAPVCSPSRAGLLTGRYPVRAGVPNNVSSARGDAGMPSQQVTIAETFKAAGYATAHIGKWHLGYSPDTMPNAQGFDYSFGHMGGCIDNYSHFFYWQGPNRHDLYENGQEVQHPGEFFQDLMVEKARTFIEEHKDQPFFMYFAINMPHYPYQGDPKWLKYYDDKGVPYPRNLYAAFLSTQDERIGQLLDAVDSRGLTNDSIVVFQSDNGHSTEERAHFGGGNAGPYRGAKFSLFEGGIRLPAAIRWPGHLPEGETRGQVAHGCDWLPTLAELCGLDLIEKDIDGKSIVSVIRSNDAPTPHDVLHWHTDNAEKLSWAVREGDWKLLGNPNDTSNKAPLTEADALFLVNLAEDMTEMRNMAAEHPEEVERLKRLHDDWWASANPNRAQV